MYLTMACVWELFVSVSSPGTYSIALVTLSQPAHNHYSVAMKCIPGDSIIPCVQRINKGFQHVDNFVTVVPKWASFGIVLRGTRENRMCLQSLYSSVLYTA